MNEKENIILDEEIKKDTLKGKINKGNIKKFIVGTALLASFAGGIGGICVYDAQVNHTEEICKISSVLNSLGNPKDKTPIGYLIHQIPAMEKEYEEKGLENVNVSYGFGVEIIESKDIVNPEKNTVFVVPSGYTLTKDENGDFIGAKKECIIVPENEELPQGYTLTNIDELGNKYGVKVIYISAQEITNYSVPSGYVLTKDENGNKIGVKQTVQESICKGFGIDCDDYNEFVTEKSLLRNR